MGRQKEDIARRAIRPTKEDPEPGEIEEAYQEARALVAIHEEPKTKASLEKHPTLHGVTKRSGDRINAIVALRLDGFRDMKISELLGIPQPEPHRLERTHPKAFAQAEAHAIQAAERKYGINLWRIRGALSDAAPRMVEVLVELAENPKIKENIRRQSAIDILNLTGVGYSRQTKGGKDRDLMKGAQNVFIQNIADKEKEYSTTIEAEDAEVISDD